jgi:hypothetical protein
MRFSVLTVLLAAAVLFGETADAGAQSARSYPWCAIYSTKGGTPTCSFTTREQCRASVSGVGGICIENAATPTPRAPSASARKRTVKK